MSIALRTALLSLVLLGATTTRTAAQEPVVHAVLFYSPRCGHCQQYIQNDLPILLDQFGSQLVILAVDIADPGGQALYRSAVDRFSIPQERQGVPTMVIGEVVLVGGGEITERSAGLIEEGLRRGGLGWPEVPGLPDLLAQLEVTPSPTPDSSLPAASAEPRSTPAAAAPAVPAQPTATAAVAATMLQVDPAGLLLASLVLLSLVAALPFVWIIFQRARRNPTSPGGFRHLFPMLGLLGSLVAAYLLSVETSGSLAFCGPIGDCNAVQQSGYARLFGIVPVAALGLLLQLVLLVLFVLTSALAASASRTAAILLLALSVAGLLFSIYLTLVEIFVLGAVCAWCLTSAMIVAGESLLAARTTGWRLPLAPAAPPSM